MTLNITTLDNGLRVVSHHMPHLESTSLGVWIDSGARAEAENEHGVSHMLEHMAFKGTSRRSALQIAEEIEAVGGDLNAATSYETTCYCARILKDDMPLAVDILADILQNPTLQDDELAREKDVICQEIHAACDSPDDVVFDVAQQLAFPQQSLGRPILGTIESVSALTKQQLQNYMQTHYIAKNMVLSAAGFVDHEALVQRVETDFAHLSPAPQETFQPARYVGGQEVCEGRFDQSHVLLAFEGLSYIDKDYYAAQVMNMVLGGGMSSRLFQEVREKRGLCYSIYSFCWGLSDTGLFGIHAATSSEHVAELLDVVAGELKILADEGPSDVEVLRAKAQLKAGLLMGLESSATRCEQLARQMLIFGEPLSTQTLVEKIEAIDTVQIQDLVRKIIGQRQPLCSGVGPMAGLKSYDMLRDEFLKYST